MLDCVITGGTVVDGTGAAPTTADVGIRDGRIVALGKVDEPARRTIDADGAIVTPGFIDLHTHYDGQVTWDDQLEPSTSNGVTTVVLGNCGVGFAPVRPDAHDELIDMMEGVEDIPGTALSVGMPWGRWSSFAEYLDLIDERTYAANVACHISHGPVRFYVMGERAYTDNDATAEEVSAMAAIVAEAIEAGAVGFSTNRLEGHMSKSGKVVPGTFAPQEELRAIAEAVGRTGRGILQAVPSIRSLATAAADKTDVDLFGELSVAAGGRPFTFTHAQVGADGQFRDGLARTAEWNAKGARLRPQIIPRAVTIMSTLDGYHPFMLRPSYRALAELPVVQRAAAMRDPEVRAAILGESDHSTDLFEAMLVGVLGRGLSRTFTLDHPVDYEPDPSASIKAQAAAAGQAPIERFYDLLVEGAGDRFLVNLGSNFQSGTLEPSREMLLDPNTVSGLSDAGAHVALISDCSSTTFHLTHWVRDRSRGPRVPLELAVHKITGAPAAMYDFHDRGVVAVGARADLNVIDLEALDIAAPRMRYDLPTGAKRILQPASGYLATMVGGEVVRHRDEDTGARPGRLVRS